MSFFEYTSSYQGTLDEAWYDYLVESMASKLQEYRKMSEEVQRQLTGSLEHWQCFLATTEYLLGKFNLGDMYEVSKETVFCGLKFISVQRPAL